MISKPFLNVLKQRLRINNDSSDGELCNLAEAARTELILAGVKEDKVNDENDLLIRTVIVTYVKAYYGFDSPDAAQLQIVFENFKKKLAISSKYGD